MEKMKKLIYYFVFGIVALVALTLLVGLVNAILTPNEPVTPTAVETEEQVFVPIEEDFDMSAEFKTAYIDGCMDGDTALYAGCECTYSKILAQYGQDRFVEIAVEYTQTQMLPKSIEDIAIQCFIEN